MPRRAGDHAGPGQGHVLPSPRLVFVICGEPVDADRKRARVAGWPQAHVDIEQPAVARERCERVDEPLAHPLVVMGQCEGPVSVRCRRVLGRVIDEYKIEIRGCRQLTTSKLA